jgi:hypothetical protein
MKIPEVEMLGGPPDAKGREARGLYISQLHSRARNVGEQMPGDEVRGRVAI